MTERKRHFKSGSTLMIVLIAAAVSAAFAVGLATAILSAANMSARDSNRQQAYFTARSAVASTVSMIEDYQSAHPQITDIDAWLTTLCTQHGSGSISGLGSYTVGVKKLPDDSGGNSYIQVSAVGTYGGISSTVSQVMVKTSTETTDTLTSGTDASNPFENVICALDTSYTHFVQGASVSGPILYYGDATISGGGTNGAVGVNVSGRFFATGNITISDSSLGITQLVSQGDIKLTNGASILSGGSAELDCGRSLSTTSSSGTARTTVNGNVYVNGNVTLYQTTVNGSVTCAGNVTLTGCTVTGGVTYGGTFTKSGSSCASQKKAAVPDVPITCNPLSVYKDTVTLPAVTNNVTVAGGQITSSGILTASTLSHAVGGTLTVDTGSTVDPGHDVYLFVNSNLTLTNQNILLKGANHLLICLANGATLTLNGSSKIGMQNENDLIRVIILGNDGEQVVQNANARLRAAVYLPKGSFTGTLTDNSAFGADDNHRFKGSIVTFTLHVTLGQTTDFIHKTVNIDNTPLFHFFQIETTKTTTFKTYLWNVKPNSWSSSP